MGAVEMQIGRTWVFPDRDGEFAAYPNPGTEIVLSALGKRSWELSVLAVYQGPEDFELFAEAYDVEPKDVCWIRYSEVTFTPKYDLHGRLTDPDEDEWCLAGPNPPDTDRGALKFDDGKPPFELLPFEALESVAKVLAYGAKKYDAHNWRKGLGRARLCGAALRHIFAYLRGQDNDDKPDAQGRLGSGLPHLAHAACCILFALTFEIEGTHDDRRGA